jgi:hypothetical protein
MIFCIPVKMRAVNALLQELDGAGICPIEVNYNMFRHYLQFEVETDEAERVWIWFQESEVV